ncbi:winged helix-turn-helix transcriptional regulator [Nocardia cyriacigeorgica]|jgi:DNA-binding MarR family transcriptional regulator|uniref:MarR family winged helix-turn-helix transcriptional regulator n=1 Tax=Nocardia cyriacigeorgica TaxID=135487 RepID=UPI0002FAAB35|nr:MarR family winged helix-turn-helix transcriptional regulator [Nocardia cyriacigeorgica]AVH22357.1 MarR family transcriptional regulator [Nocardia cyriacigeorgica]MBF6086529.1 winged helix-turn-helix transcriptional regulator [Nocardia cyriacigeorgica]MBF6091158.1 winged helix-turn-helix transcriptional regulator [Nocardia cyriacigeorgica]MBF6097460.1 winged helix-turn-helix transcriptional regulator [Nocardia cyriacigeorgica]MBF6321970.1 winged helix-turn-helix transcriptional regulator [N
MNDVERVERAMVEIRRRQTRRTLAPGGEPAGQAFDVLDVVGAATDPTVSTVAEALAVDRPRASRLVAAAVDAGYIERIADQSDGRRSLLAVTPAGRAVLRSAHQRRIDAFDSAMHNWTDADRARFADLLTRFVAGMPHRGPTGAQPE